MKLQSFPRSGPISSMISALQDFREAWRRQSPRIRGPDMRQIHAFGILFACGAIIYAAISLDESGSLWAKTLPSDIIHIFERITRLGDSGYVFVLTILAMGAGVLARRGQVGRPAAALTLFAGRAMYLFAVAAGSGLASQFLKHLFGRARPQLHDRFPEMIGVHHFDLFSIYASYASFPSGHAVTAFAMALAIAFLSPWTGLLLFPVASLVGLSRIVIGSHYASDVAAGVAIGLASAIYLRSAFARRRIVFRATPRGIVLRGRGLIWRALRRRPDQYLRIRLTSLP